MYVCYSTLMYYDGENNLVYNFSGKSHACIMPAEKFSPL